MHIANDGNSYADVFPVPKFIAYNDYVRAMSEEVMELAIELNGVFKHITDISNDELMDYLQDRALHVLNAVAFLLENPELKALEESVVANCRTLLHHPNRSLIDDNNYNPSIFVADVMISDFARLAEFLISKSDPVLPYELIDNDKSFLRSQLHQIETYRNKPSSRFDLYVGYLNPYIDTLEVNRFETIALDVDSLIGFGNVFAAALSRGDSIEAIEKFLAMEYDLSLRSYLVPLFRDYPDAIRRIESNYQFTHEGESVTFEELVANWAERHYVANRPSTQLFNLDSNFIEIGRIQYHFSNGFDPVSYLKHPFNPSIEYLDDRKEITQNSFEANVPIYFLEGAPQVKGTLDVPISAWRILNSEFPGGLQRVISIN